MTRNTAYSLILSAALSAGLVGCNLSDKSSTQHKSSNPDVEIKSESFDFDMLSAQQIYKIATDDSTIYYLTLNANVQYPDEIGDYQLKALQDTLGTLIAGKHMESIDEAITHFVTNPEKYEIGDHYKRVDSIPGDMNMTTSFYSNVDISIEEFTHDIITYTCNYEEFLGGAHAMFGSRPFTYLLDKGVFVTNKWLFKPGTEQEVSTQILQALMAETEMSESDLRQTMLVSYVPIPESVFLENGMIVFRYNPYEILPYSFGSIDAKVSPYNLTEALTPAAKALLVEEI